MTEGIKNGQRRLFGNFGRRCLLLGSALVAATFFFSCNTDVPGGDAASEAKQYTVEHWTQEIDTGTGKVYDALTHSTPNYKLKDSEKKSGKTGEKTAASAKAYEGFNAQEVVQKSIAAAGKTVVQIYYVRKDVTLTFKANGGKFGDSTDGKTLQGKYGESIAASEPETPQKTDGSSFLSWAPEKPAAFPASDREYTAQWKDPQAANYAVIHWWQPAVVDKYAEHERETLSGSAGTHTAAAVKTYPGFHLSTVAHAGGTITQQKINAAGSTVVNIYYDRNTVTVSFNTDGGTAVGSKSGRYGAPLLKPTDPTKTGNSFAGWEPQLPEEFPLNDTEYKAKWTAEVQPQYKVEHWLQKIDASGKACDATAKNDTNYDLKDTDTKSGKKGTPTQAAANVYAGFDTPAVTQATIQADGSTVVKIYYVRKNITLTFKPNGGKFGTSAADKTVQGKYGEKIQEADVGKPVKDDSDFDDWDSILPQNFPDKNKEYTAQWKTVKELKIKTEPTKKEYSVGETFDKSGLQVYVKYDNYPDRPLTDTEYSIAGFDSMAAGVKTITVTYKGKSTSFTVTVKAATPPSETFAFGDIIDKDGKKYKKDAFTPAAGKTWQDYYVIIAVDGSKYVGVRYFDNTGWGDVELGSSIINTYRNQPDSFHRYLNKDDVAAIFKNLSEFKESVKKIKSSGITPGAENFTEQNCIYKGRDDFGDDAYFNGNNTKIESFNDRDILPIIARDFN